MSDDRLGGLLNAPVTSPSIERRTAWSRQMATAIKRPASISSMGVTMLCVEANSGNTS